MLFSRVVRGRERRSGGREGGKRREERKKVGRERERESRKRREGEREERKKGGKEGKERITCNFKTHQYGIQKEREWGHLPTF